MRTGCVRREVFSAWRARSRVRGVSLLELLVVVVLIAGITAVAAGVMSGGLAGQQLRGAARELAGQLRYARAQAIVSGQPQVFRLDADSRQWDGPKHRHGQVPANILIRATTARIEQGHPGEAVIRFFPEGASTGGRIVLVHDRAAWQIDVDWLTGRVSLARAESPP